jgi:hypothetical protein
MIAESLLSSKGNTPDNSSSTMPFLASLVAARDVFSPSAIWIAKH